MFISALGNDKNKIYFKMHQICIASFLFCLAAALTNKSFYFARSKSFIERRDNNFISDFISENFAHSILKWNSRYQFKFNSSFKEHLVKL